MALLAAALSLGGAAAWLNAPAPGEPAAVLVASWPVDGSPIEASRRLAELGVVRNAVLFGWFVALMRPVGRPQPGEHVFAGHTSPLEVWRRLTRSASRARIEVMLPEGYNRFQVARRLEERSICTAQSFTRAATSREALDRAGLSQSSAEGYLFPATYKLRGDTPAAEVLRVLVAEGRRRYAQLAATERAAIERLEREQDWGEHEVLTLASMVEKEAQRADELPLIASVFFNRLKRDDFRPRRMLQSDPTAAYGCLLEPTRAACAASPDGRVTPAMLRDEGNLYNTYAHPGLPPGPIASPGEAAIRAVLAPAATDYLFFVAAGQGKHAFTRTYTEHQQAIVAPPKSP